MVGRDDNKIEELPPGSAASFIALKYIPPRTALPTNYFTNVKTANKALANFSKEMRSNERRARARQLRRTTKKIRNESKERSRAESALPPRYEFALTIALKPDTYTASFTLYGTKEVVRITDLNQSDVPTVYELGGEASAFTLTKNKQDYLQVVLPERHSVTPQRLPIVTVAVPQSGPH